MHDLLVALLLGFSFGNLWLCAILVFSLQTTNRFTCLGYLVGRAATIVLLALFLSLVGSMVSINRAWLNFISAFLLIGFSIILAATQLWGWVPPWRRKTSSHTLDVNGCDGHCDSCPTKGHHEYAQACADCHDHGVCAAEEPEVEALTLDARRTWGKTDQNGQKSGFVLGATLGALRGAAMCSKLVVLAPLILQSSPLRSLALGSLFALSSSLYPLLGFLLGKFALRLIAYKRHLFITSCLFIAGSGVHYLIGAFRHL